MRILSTGIIWTIFWGTWPALVAGQSLRTPRIERVIPSPRQPHAADRATIWYDDFDGPPKQYGEATGPLDDSQSLSDGGKSLRCFYRKGSQGTGGRKVFFGDAPVYSQSAPRRGESFDEIYWRIYVKHQAGWRGAPAKMSRATILADSHWAQAMIAHVWSGPGDSLTLDPVRGVDGRRVVTRRYNDFERIKWLGNRPASRFPIHATEESGWWVSVECRAKLNTPGKRDGVNQLWIDGRLECERRGLDWRGSYTERGINAVFLEAYWNRGSPVTQSRWYDNLVISTRPIGPVVCPANPVLVLACRDGEHSGGGWEFEVSGDLHGRDVVFRSNRVSGNRAVVDPAHGKFIGPLAGRHGLAANQVYYVRARYVERTGSRSAWSRWHQGFRVAP